jgi:ATP-dependent DNA helicase RecG
MQLLKIEDLIGETTEYDKKQAVELKRPKSWCKSVSAFANTTGGALIFGIADDDSIIGLKHAEEDSEKISEIIKNRIMPLPDFNMQFYKTADGKKLIILHIHKGEETPYYYSADGTTEAYIRVGNESVPAKATDLKRLVLRGRNSSFDSLDTAYHASDYSFSKLRERYKIWTGKSFPEGALISWGIQNEKGDLTNAGALLADESPIRYSRVFCTRWNGKTKSGGVVDALDHQEYSGSVISLLNNAEAFIKVNSKTIWKKTDNSRLEFPEYIHRSYFEALVNALVHRDYLDYGSEVHVDIFDDRLEIYSPGGMFDGTRVQDRNIRKIPSRRRNPVLSDIFDRLGYMERSGSGFGKILDGYEEAGNYRDQKEPEFYSDSTMFLVTLPNLNYPYPVVLEPAKSAEKPLDSLEPAKKPANSLKSAKKPANYSNELTPRQKEALQIMEYGIEYRTKEMADLLGLKPSRTREIMNELLHKGYVRGTASTKNRRYVKVKKESREN